MSCPKCGTWKPPSGPFQATDEAGEKCLKYCCVDCDHSWTTAGDQKRTNGFAELPDHSKSGGAE